MTMKKQNLRYMKWIGKMIVLLFIFNFQFSIFDCSAQRVSLDECLEKALESNFSIKIIRNEARMDKNNLNYSTFLPTLEGTAKQTQTRNDTKTENSAGEVNKMSDVKTDNYTAGVALNWRIFDGLEMFTTHEKQKELLAMGELAVQQAVENLILNVSAAYYNVLVQHHKLMAARHSLELSNERYDEARVRYKIGNRSGLEAQQAKIDLNTDSSTYVRQKEALKSAYITLNKLMNTDLQMVNYVQDTILLGTAQRADAKELNGLRLHALRTIDHHDGGVGGHERTVRIFRKVLVAGGVQDIHAAAIVGELQHRRSHRDAALLLDLHPVGDRVLGTALPLYRTCRLDGAGIEEELLGKCGLARVRVRDDGEGASRSDLFGDAWHGSPLRNAPVCHALTCGRRRARRRAAGASASMASGTCVCAPMMCDFNRTYCNALRPRPSRLRTPSDVESVRVRTADSSSIFILGQDCVETRLLEPSFRHNLARE